MLILTNFKYKNGYDFDNIDNLKVYLSTKLQAEGITCNLNKNGVDLYFKNMKSKISTAERYFLSAKENKIKINDEARIKKLGRDFLTTDRMSERQSVIVWKLLNEGIEKFNLDFDILVRTTGTDQRLRIKNEILKSPLTSDKYPLE